MPELNQDRGLNSSDQTSYRYWTLGYSGECRITETHVECKIRNWHRRWEQSVPLILVSAHVTRLTHTPDSYWWTSVVCGSGFGIGIWGVISPEQTGLSGIVAIPVILVSALLLVYLLKFRRVVWCIFSTAIPNTTIAFCRNAAPDSAFETFTEKLQSAAAFKYPPETTTHKESQLTQRNDYQVDAGITGNRNEQADFAEICFADFSEVGLLKIPGTDTIESVERINSIHLRRQTLSESPPSIADRLRKFRANIRSPQ